MSSLLKPRRADNENFSVIEPQVLRNVPNETCASVPTDRVISYLGKVLSEFSGKLALLRGEKKKKKGFFRVLKIKFEKDAFRKVVAQAN